MIYQKRITTKNATDTLTLLEMGEILCASSDAQTYTLPTASGHKGLWYRIINTNTGIVTVSDGSDVAVLASNEKCLVLSDGTDWQVHESINVHNDFNGLNAGDYVHLTAAEYAANAYSSDIPTSTEHVVSLNGLFDTPSILASSNLSITNSSDSSSITISETTNLALTSDVNNALSTHASDTSIHYLTTNIPLASTEERGLMSTADKLKLDQLSTDFLLSSDLLASTEYVASLNGLFENPTIAVSSNLLLTKSSDSSTLTISESSNIALTSDVGVGGSTNATDIYIDDTGGYYTGGNVELALQEIHSTFNDHASSSEIHYLTTNIPLASSEERGLMSTADKIKIDQLSTDFVTSSDLNAYLVSTDLDNYVQSSVLTGYVQSSVLTDYAFTTDMPTSTEHVESINGLYGNPVFAVSSNLLLDVVDYTSSITVSETSNLALKSDLLKSTEYVASLNGLYENPSISVSTDLSISVSSDMASIAIGISSNIAMTSDVGGGGATNAVDIAINDTGGYYTGGNVELALQEIHSTFSSHANSTNIHFLTTNIALASTDERGLMSTADKLKLDSLSTDASGGLPDNYLFYKVREVRYFG